MKFLDSKKIAGATARIVETRFYYIINGHVYDKATMTPRGLEFVEGVQGCNCVPSTKKHIAVMNGAEGLYENQQSNFIVDSEDSTITYIPIQEYHTSTPGVYNRTRLLKVRETPTSFQFLTATDNTQPTTHGWIREIVSQSRDYLFAIVGTSNTNRVYLQRFLKSDLTLNLTMFDVGAWVDWRYLGEKDDEMIFMYMLPSTAANKWQLHQINKLSNTRTSVTVMNGSAANLCVIPTDLKLVSDKVYKQYHAYIRPADNLITICLNTYDFTKVGASANAAILTKVDLIADHSWLPANNNAIMKLVETTGADGSKYLTMIRIQTSTTTSLSAGNHIVYKIDSETGALTRVGASTGDLSTALVKGCIPVNNGRNLVLITTSSAVIATFDEVTKTFKNTKEIVTNPYSVAVDDFENIYITNLDFSVTKLNPGMPTDIKMEWVNPLGTWSGSNLSNGVKINAYNGSAERIAVQVRLLIDGSNAVWDANTSREITITTKADEDLIVPITITKGGSLIVRPTLV